MTQNKTIKNMKLTLDKKAKEINTKIKIIEELNTKIKNYESKIKSNEKNNFELETNKNNILKENQNLKEIIKTKEEEIKILNGEKALILSELNSIKSNFENKEATANCSTFDIERK